MTIPAQKVADNLKIKVMHLHRLTKASKISNLTYYTLQDLYILLEFLMDKDTFRSKALIKKTKKFVKVVQDENFNK